MSVESMRNLITKMNNHLNHLIESNKYNLQNEEIIRYSKKLDRVLLHYSRRKYNRMPHS